jgi:hypothetical protein
MSEYDDEAPPRRTGDLYEPEEMILKPRKFNFRRRMKSEAGARGRRRARREPRFPQTLEP